MAKKLGKKPQIKRNLSPKEDYATQSLAQMRNQEKDMEPRQFRDALTRAGSAVVGVKTNTLQWNRWSV